MLPASSNFGNSKECVLKCEDATHFFDFPSEDIFRNLWLYKLGLEHCDHTFRVCDKHFSENMRCSGGKKLVDLAVPDQNLPDTLLKRKEIYDQLIKKISITKVPERRAGKKQITARKRNCVVASTNVKTSSEPPMNVPITNASLTNIPVTHLSTSNMPTRNLPIENFAPDTTVKDWLNDSSTLLMDYQLRFQGKHMCDVIEIPEYIVVFTAFKAKALRNVLVQNKSKESEDPVLSIPSSITVARNPNKIKNNSEGIKRINDDDIDSSPITTQAPEIEFVYYMTDGGIPRREREVQVNIPTDTNETAVQCDVELESDIMQMILNSHLSNVSTAQVNMYECLVCGEIVANNASKVRHASKHENVCSLCPHCGKVFPNKLKLNAHEKDVHLENNLEIKKALRCPKLHCNKAFHSRKQLNNHIYGHVSNAEHKCLKCLRLFSSSLKLYCHQKAFKNCLKWTKMRRWSKGK